MEIRESRTEDINDIMKIFAAARAYMTAHGNATQWGAGYPNEDVLLTDIQNHNNYVILDQGEIVGTFSFIIGSEPTYQIIRNGAWHETREYGTIHRLASSGTTRGIARACFRFCLEQIDYLRIDTHKDNLSMQAAIENFGFRKCGNIYVRDGSERIAYDKYKNGEIEFKLDEADQVASASDVRNTSDEVFGRVRERIDGK